MHPNSTQRQCNPLINIHPSDNSIYYVIGGVKRLISKGIKGLRGWFNNLKPSDTIRYHQVCTQFTPNPEANAY
jgi:hypothetical protein